MREPQKKGKKNRSKEKLPLFRLPLTQLARPFWVYFFSSGLGSKDIDLAEVHDCFFIAEIMHYYENLSFCQKGEGGDLVDKGKTYFWGDMPVNVSGDFWQKAIPSGRNSDS